MKIFTHSDYNFKDTPLAFLSILSRNASDDLDIDVTVGAKKREKKNSPWRQNYLTTSLSRKSILMFSFFFSLLPITVIRPLDLCVLHKFKDFIWYPCS